MFSIIKVTNGNIHHEPQPQPEPEPEELEINGLPIY